MRRLLALALVLLPLQGSAATLVAGAPEGHAHCSGDACRCVSHCPPKKPSASLPCHETEAPLGALLQAARCHGGQDEAAAPVSSRPQLTPAPLAASPELLTFALATAAPAGALPGFLHIDLPPPRTA
jgi:hypothetical protein